MTKEFKFNQEDLLEVMGEVDETTSSIVEKLEGVTITVKEEEEAYVGANLHYEGEFYLGDLYNLIGDDGELMEVYGYLDEDGIPVITEVTSEGYPVYSANYVVFQDESAKFPSGWTISI